MKSFIDTIITNIPIVLIILVFIFLILSEFAGVCISFDKLGEILHGVIIGHQVKVLG